MLAAQRSCRSIRQLRRAGCSLRCEPSWSALRWTPSPEGVVMINVDAAVFEVSNKMGIGVAIGNHWGDCILALNHSVDSCPSPKPTEAIAARRALLLAAEEGNGNVILVSGCLSLVLKLKSHLLGRSCTGTVVSDVKATAALCPALSFM